ncbi:TetR/AcrR family transcriptional regulator [Roseibium aggregatum]|uniref:TetR/AcrR family transcriptional regulator n=1 Tax=Roseibium aggregatum TaxID=187304 RepID=UPI001E3835C4|nr:TetR family transcriptional regulator [Roseibium aggregatum]UES36620.1 TetR family transcriptional regulator [Roseibium aggregatum]
MARPSKFDREDALDVVMNQIWQTGYRNNSVKSLAEVLGITRSSFYNAFGSQEQLFKEVLARYTRVSPDRVLAHDNSNKLVRGVITEFFQDICRLRARDPEWRGCMAVNAISELCSSHPELGPVLAEVIFGSLERLERLLKLGVETGELPKDYDIRSSALAVQTLMIGINTLSKVVHSEKSLWLACEATLKGLDLLEKGRQASECKMA